MGPLLKKNLCTYTQNHLTAWCKSWDITLWELDSFSYFLSLSGWSFPLEMKRHQAVRTWAWKSLICYFLYSSAQTYHSENLLGCEWKTALSQWASGSRERTCIIAKRLVLHGFARSHMSGAWRGEKHCWGCWCTEWELCGDVLGAQGAS